MLGGFKWHRNARWGLEVGAGERPPDPGPPKSPIALPERDTQKPSHGLSSPHTPRPVVKPCRSYMNSKP